MLNSSTITLMRNVSFVGQEYLILVAQLETQHRQGHLTLLKCQFYVQSVLQTMASRVSNFGG
jgi:hypothetical protein